MGGGKEIILVLNHIIGSIIYNGMHTPNEHISTHALNHVV